MKLPRDVSGAGLAKGLARVGYPVTLSVILSVVGQHLQLGKEQLVSKLKL